MAWKGSRRRVILSKAQGIIDLFSSCALHSSAGAHIQNKLEVE